MATTMSCPALEEQTFKIYFQIAKALHVKQHAQQVNLLSNENKNSKSISKESQIIFNLRLSSTLFSCFITH